MIYSRLTSVSVLFCLLGSCTQVPDSPVIPNPPPAPSEEYIYPFSNEPAQVTAEIVITSASEEADLSNVQVEIPPLKYNKTLLVMLSQDDCKHAAYSTTWAAINGRPLSDTYYYSASQLQAGDLPPDVYTLKKTLGSTDGTGREVRFSFLTTLAAEWEYMDDRADVKPGFTENCYRFYMKEGLTWENVAEMVNYGVGIAFHDVNTEQTDNPEVIAEHYKISQDSILKHLSGRGCKLLAEPNGNKAYVTAAAGYDPIQSILLQTGGIALQPWQADDLLNTAIIRKFTDPDQSFAEIEKQMALPVGERAAINIGVHGTDRSWVDFLLRLNDTYGKDGADCLWMPSPEEYFEYNYLRHHTRISPRVEGNELHLTVELPGRLYFYYPSLTLNLRGLSVARCATIDAGATVSGLSYGDFSDNLMINIDCRHALEGHAEHFVQKYEQSSTTANRADAFYFVNMLKPSARKDALMKRLK